MEPDHSPRLIDLALEPAFELGGLEVRPATLEVLAGARREQLEPRIMQVLVALARRRGEVVSRDELIQACWGGRVVGDDSVNRCIFRLRKLAEALGGFQIGTVPRVGFRLSEAPAGVQSAAARGRRPWAALALAGVLALVLAAGGWWLWQGPLAPAVDPAPRIAVLPFTVLDGDPASRTFSARLTDELTGVLNENAVGPTPAGDDPAQAAKDADLILGGTVSREGDLWRVRAHIEDGRAKFTLWSGEFTGPVADEAALRDQTAASLTDVVFTALDPLQQRGLKIDARTLALYIKASEALKNPATMSFAKPLEGFEQVVARAPRFGVARATLAYNLVFLSERAGPAERDALRKRARGEAEQAARLGQPGAGAAADAFYTLARAERPGELVGAEDALLKAIASGAKFATVPMRECRFLLEVGRTTDALQHCQQAVALRPLMAPIGWTYAAALDAAGSQRQARETIRDSVRFHPDHFQTRRVNFEFVAFAGTPDDALRMLRDPKRAPLLARASQVEAVELFLKARKSQSAADIDAAIAALRATEGDRFSRRFLVLAAAMLGRPDDAFAALADPRLSIAGDPGILLEPQAAPLRADPRFWAAAARAGYVRYWRTRDRWPDFCSDPAVRIDCRREAAKAAG